MHSLSPKQLALEAIQRLPDNVDFDEIMYRLYLLGKTLQGIQDIEAGRIISQNPITDQGVSPLICSQNLADEIFLLDKSTGATLK